MEGEGASTCGLGWLEMEPSVCVRIQTQALTWSQASNECRKRGGHLMDTISTGHRWRFFQERLPLKKAYWINKVQSQKMSEDGLECRSVHQEEHERRIKLVLKLSENCDEHHQQDGYICERRMHTSSTGRTYYRILTKST
ncbi:hypothetical protein ElyMa_000978300 [Elysia marginata]|uniref:C-type lectin domain-containing protein n=1 Tax=Elysia marginata TaxID=1093978 RepID=A0AAV4HGY9_9GAST|nr:hypothetical protein ElyMa_000978300 [Elysia marginata]